MKAKVLMTWGNYSNSTRLYNSFRNEWDLCDQLDPTSTPDSDWEEDNFNFLDPIPDPLPPPPPAPSSLRHEVAPSFNYTKGVECFVTHLQFHLDFHLAALTTRSIGGSATFESWVKKQKFSHICNIVGDSGKDVNSISDVQKHVITCFIGYLATLPTSQLSEIPSNHWDLAPRTPLSTSNVFIQVSYLNIFSWEQLHVIQPSQSRSLIPWKLMVLDTATAMMCLHHDWGSDVLIIALKLLKKGIAFKTLQPMAVSPHARHPLSELCTYSLRYFQPPFKAVYADYITYEQYCHKFMKEDYAVPFGQMLSLNGEAHFDDDLSEEEVDFICRMYYVYMNNGCIEKLSWWPRPQAWAGSELDVGFWSA
ncbi:hypothetical protein DFH29DRAFT_875015 [Suillus ampliporus]|nr:hypothetical protein DFH29DRAFT_875015 [Suillus ampliporus]